MELAALDVYPEETPGSAARHMALDEALLRTTDVPALRFYRWRAPAASFGYFSRYAEVEALAAGRELVRRWTGGGIVLHGEDLTYAFVLPRSALRSRVIYEAVHRAICAALDGRAALAAAAAPRVSDACFANPVAADVLLDGRKVAGAAQRRTRTGLLQQGSIQGVKLPANFPEAFARALCPEFKTRSFSEETQALAESLEAEKYASLAWLRAR